MIEKLAGVVLFAALAAGCGTSTTDPTTGITTDRYAGTLVDPTSCNCGNGINQYAVVVAKDGVVEATATWTQTDAVVILRLTDNSFNTVYAVSTANGTTARLAHNAPAGQYQMQVFLNQGPGRTATFNLEIKHP
jgi:hypothetical protein